MASGDAVIPERFTASWMPACRYRSAGFRQPEYFPMADHWEIAMLPPTQKALPSEVNRFQEGGPFIVRPFSQQRFFASGLEPVVQIAIDGGGSFKPTNLPGAVVDPYRIAMDVCWHCLR